MHIYMSAHKSSNGGGGEYSVPATLSNASTRKTLHTNLSYQLSPGLSHSISETDVARRGGRFVNRSLYRLR